MQVEMLKEELSRRMEKNPNYSLRAFAKALNINSGTLSAVINRKRPLGEKLIQKMVNELPFDSKDREKFLGKTNLRTCISELKGERGYSRSRKSVLSILRRLEASCSSRDGCLS